MDGPIHTAQNNTHEPSHPEPQELMAPESSLALSTITQKASRAPHALKPEDLLHVQRTRGNAAARSLIAARTSSSRQRASALGATNALQRQPRRIPSRVGQIQENIQITTAAGPTIDPRFAGNSSWSVQFRLPTSAANDGFIIQECRTQTFDRSRGRAPLHDTRLWEAWEVVQGMTTPVRIVGVSGDDTYETSGPGFPTFGELRITGIVCFYEGPLPPEFGPYNPSQHYYPQQPNPPSGWTGRGTPHSVTFTWDRRSGRPSSDCLTANAAGTITRVGTCTSGAGP